MREACINENSPLRDESCRETSSGRVKGDGGRKWRKGKEEESKKGERKLASSEREHEK